MIFKVMLALPFLLLIACQDPSITKDLEESGSVSSTEVSSSRALESSSSSVLPNSSAEVSSSLALGSSSSRGLSISSVESSSSFTLGSISSSSGNPLWGGGLLWNLEVAAYQVQVPCVLNNTPTGDVNGDDVIDTYDCAGWFYADASTGADYSPRNPDGSLITTDPINGIPLGKGSITNTGFQITLIDSAAVNGVPTEASLGFDWFAPLSEVDISLSDGFCLLYELSGASLELVLAWDETKYGSNMWYMPLPVTLPANTTGLVELRYASFMRDGGVTVMDDSSSFENALKHSIGLRFRLRNTENLAKVATFEINLFGDISQCPVFVIKSLNPSA